jgi:hypothetical protein
MAGSQRRDRGRELGIGHRGATRDVRVSHGCGLVGCLPLELTITLITGLALVAVLSPDQTRREAAAEVLDQLLSALTHRPPRP